MYLTEPPPLTSAQSALCSSTATLLHELRGLRALVRDLDGAREDVEGERTVDASFCAEELLEHFIAALGDQTDSAGVMLPLMARAA